MIKRINRLQNFGVFRDFTGDAASGVSEFKKRNLIYGWNYSGKTTLSRIFACLEHENRDLDFSDGRFRVECEDGGVLTELSRDSPLTIRVFNREYINANFQHEHRAPAIFIVGEENVIRRDLLNRINQGLDDLGQRKVAREEEAAAIQDNLNSAATNRARDVGSLLGVRTFRRPDLERRIQEVRIEPLTYRLPEGGLNSKIATVRSGEDARSLGELNITLPDLRAISESVRALLCRTASFDAIESLRGNSELENWVRQGLILHSETKECSFCGSEISDERMDRLGRHFSEAYTALHNQITAAIRNAEALSLEPPRLDQAQFLNELRGDAQSQLAALSDWLIYARAFRDEQLGALKLKLSNIESESDWQPDLSRADEGVEALIGLNTLIARHNDLIANIDQTITTARAGIERHYAALHFEEEQILAKEGEIARLGRKATYTERAMQRLALKAEGIKREIDRAARGATRFLELVNFLLRDADITIDSVADTEFQLKRSGRVASKLSDGERTAIAFAYFVTSLERDGEYLEDSIVFVDDPISSLDSNHIYAVYALIHEHLEKCAQLFVSTHSSEFFNLLKSRWLKNRDRQFRRNSGGFYIRKKQDEDGQYSVLEALPHLLFKYSSEYEFIFAQLYAFQQSPEPSEHEAYTAPNLLRRFLEAYLGFRKPSVTAWHDKLDLILDSAEERREVHKILDDASHLQNMARAMHEPSYVALAQQRVAWVFDGLQLKDAEHFESLVEVVTQTA